VSFAVGVSYYGVIYDIMEENGNMKIAKAAALIMSLSIAGMSLAACSNEPEPVSSDINIISTQAQGQNTGVSLPNGHVDPNAESENFVFTYKGCDFVVNTVVDESKFPDEDYDAQVQASCAGQGMATNYKFKGGSFWAETYPGSDSLYIVTLCDDTVTTAEGIYIGSTMDKVKEVYGEPSTATDTLLVYEKGSSELRFNFDANGAVNGIFYIGKF